MNEKEKRKILISSIIIIITLILVVVGTTYAFFSLQIQNSSEPTNIEITTGEQNEITLSGGITGYHINLDVSDMTKDKVGKSYYGTTVSGEKYKTDELDGTQDIGTLTKTGTLTEKYSCNVGINITLDGDMKEFLQANDLVLVVKQGSTSSTYDLSEETTQYTFSFKLDNDSIEPIKAYLKFTNQDTDQSDLAGTELNITISINDFACEIDNSKPALEMLTEKGGETFKEKSGMYRFVGTKDEVTNNYICFGTTDSSKCGTNASLEDNQKYMYRIIGITSTKDDIVNIPADSLKLIKATPSITSQNWHSSYSSDVEWDASAVKSYLNGTFYNSITSAQPNGAYWDSIILSHKWYIKDQKSIENEEPKDTQNISTESKIGLMYATDYKNSGDQDTNNWLFIKNGWTDNTAVTEWTMSRYGLNGGGYGAWRVRSGGGLGGYGLNNTNAVRPVFYLQSNITLTGEGTTENPFIIHLSSGQF